MPKFRKIYFANKGPSSGGGSLSSGAEDRKKVSKINSEIRSLENELTLNARLEEEAQFKKLSEITPVNVRPGAGSTGSKGSTPTPEERQWLESKGYMPYANGGYSHELVQQAREAVGGSTLNGSGSTPTPEERQWLESKGYMPYANGGYSHELVQQAREAVGGSTLNGSGSTPTPEERQWLESKGYMPYANGGYSHELVQQAREAVGGSTQPNPNPTEGPTPNSQETTNPLAGGSTPPTPDPKELAKQMAMKKAQEILLWVLLGLLILSGVLIISVVAVCAIPKYGPEPIKSFVNLALPESIKAICGDDKSNAFSCPTGYIAWKRDASGAWVQTTTAAAGNDPTGGSGEIGSGAGNISCLAIGRNGKYADPYLRAIARATGSCGIEAPCQGDGYVGYGGGGDAYYGRYQYGFPPRALNSWDDDRNATGNQALPDARELLRVADESIQSGQLDTKYKIAQDKLFMDVLTGTNRGNGPRLMTALKTENVSEIAVALDSFCNQWNAMCNESTPGGKATSIAKRFIPLLAEEKSGSCGQTAFKNDSENQTNKNLLNNLAKVFGPIEVNAQSTGKYSWVVPGGSFDSLNFVENGGRFTRGDDGSGGVDLTIAKPGNAYEQSRGTPVVAHQSGEVTHIEKSDTGYGNQVGVFFPSNGVTAIFSHLESINVAVGQSVQPGSLLGTQGSSGSTRGGDDGTGKGFVHIDLRLYANKVQGDPGGVLPWQDDRYNQFVDQWLSYYDQNSQKIADQNFAPTTGTSSGSGDVICCPPGVSPDSASLGGSGTQGPNDPNVDTSLNGADQGIVALMETIAEWEAPGYNSRYPGKTFNDQYHPAILDCGNIGGEQICSDASGKYQFISTTWLQWALDAGLKPENGETEATIKQTISICNASPSSQNCKDSLEKSRKAFKFGKPEQDFVVYQFLYRSGMVTKLKTTEANFLNRTNSPFCYVAVQQWASSPCGTQEPRTLQEYLNKYKSSGGEVATTEINPISNRLALLEKTETLSNIFNPIQVEAQEDPSSAAQTPTIAPSNSGCVYASNSPSGGSSGDSSGVSTPTNSDPDFVSIMLAISQEPCACRRLNSDFRGNCTGCCYAAVWDGLRQVHAKNPNSPWGKLFTQLNGLTVGYEEHAIDFAQVLNLSGQNGKKNYESNGMRNLVDEGIWNPNDPKVPAGAIIVIRGGQSVGSPAGDINVKLTDGSFVNYGDMPWMKNVTQSEVAGIYIPK